MLLSLFVFSCCVFSAIGLPNPQRLRSSSESPGKPGEKSERSLDQVAYNDGVNRGRSNFKDSYGNPVTLEYDTLEQVDSKQPSKQDDPNKFIIPGYASGILLPHEVPTRSFNSETARSIDDDRIHFIDPLQNSFQNSDKSFQAPSPSLSLPNNEPIKIPRPNIDLNETPQAPVDDPLNHALSPPRDNTFAAPLTPSSAFEVPQGVFIPRPNLDISETPIDNSNGPLNQGLLPPSADGSRSTFDTNVPPFISPTQGGPIVFTEGNVNFAPKPSNGLLPPKDPSPNDINFQGEIPQTTQSNVNKFSFGGPSGILGNTVGKIPDKVENTVNKFTGSFGGSPGILGGTPVSNSRKPASSQIPVTLVQAPAPTSPVLLPPAPPASNNKFTGSFGGAPGILINEQFAKPAATQPSLPTAAAPTQASFSPAAPTQAAPAISTNLNNKFGGNFGGSSGILGGSSGILGGASAILGDKPSPSLQPPTTNTQLPSRGSQKYTGNFGGLPGILSPYDNATN